MDALGEPIELGVAEPLVRVGELARTGVLDALEDFAETEELTASGGVVVEVGFGVTAGVPEVLVVLQDVECAADGADGVGTRTFDSIPSEPSCSDTLLEARGAGPWTGLSFHIVVRALAEEEAGEGPGIPLPYCRSALLGEGTGASYEPGVYMP